MIIGSEVATISARGHDALSAVLWELAEAVGAIRRAGAPEWLCDRAGARVAIGLNIVCPSAGELVRAGIDVDEALEVVEQRGERLRHLTGEAW